MKDEMTLDGLMNDCIQGEGMKDEKKEVEMTTLSLSDLLMKHRKAGRKDVVDWIEENNGRPDHILDLWKAQLKEWGYE